MQIKNRISMFVVTFLITGLIFLASPEKVLGGSGMPPIQPGCCQVQVIETGQTLCNNSENGACQISSGQTPDGFFPGESCNEQLGLCIDPVTNVPTLSEWGLIALAGILGVIGFIMVIRKRKVTA